MSDMGKAVFLSYASQDADAARQICEALRSGGVEVWFDADGGLEHGDEWDAKIRRQIKECVLFIPLISANTQARHEGYFRIEWELAAQRTLGIASGVPFILPVVIDDTLEPEALVPDRFRAVQWTRLPGGSVSPDVLQRFLKLWSHRIGVVSHQAAQSAGGSTLAELAPPSTKRRPRWIVPAMVGVFALAALAFWQPWKDGKSKTVLPAASSKPASEARELAARARSMSLDNYDSTVADYEAAESLVKQALELDPNDGEIWAVSSQLNFSFRSRGFDHSPARMAAAHSQAERALTLAPNSVEAQFALGRWQRDNEEPEIAEQTFKSVLTRDPNHSGALYNLAWIYERLDRLDEAAALYKRYSVLPGQEALGNYLQFLLYFHRAQFEEADQCIRQSVKTESSANARAMLALLLLTWKGDADGAARVLASGSAEVRSEPRTIWTTVMAQLCQRAPDVVLKTLERYSDDYIQDNWFAGPKTYFEGRAQALAGRMSAARVAWEKGLSVVDARLKENPQSENLRLMRGELLALLGQTDAAMAEARTLQELSSGKQPLWFISPARIYADLGRADLAVPLLRDQLASGHEDVGWPLTRALLRIDPLWDKLRDDARFQALCAEPQRASAVSGSTGASEVPSASLAQDDKSVAVLLFENRSAGGEDAAFLADGIQEDLINTLSRVPGLKVIARTAVLTYRGGATPLSQIASALRVNHLVEAGVQRAGDRVRINVQLIRASDGEAVWSERYDRTLSATNIFDLQEEITQAVANTLQLKLGVKSGEKLLTGTTGNLAAYELFLKARKEWSEPTGSTQKAIELFQEAIRLDPNYALAYGGLAEAYVTLANEGNALSADVFPKAKAAAEHALQLDGHIVQAYTALAEYAFHYDWNWEEAEKAILRALVIDPNYATAYARHAGHLRAWGRFAEAEAAARRANELSPTPNDFVGLGIKLDQRRWQDILDLTAAYASPEATDYLGSRAIALLHLGRKDEALRRFERAVELYPDNISAKASLGWAYGQAGEIAKAREIVEQLKVMAGNRYISPLRIAKVAAGMNDRDLAFSQLERAFELRDPNLPFIGEESEYDPIRDDPRFQDLLKRLKLDVFFPETAKP